MLLEDRRAAYLALARTCDRETVDESGLARHAASLPLLTAGLFDQLGEDVAQMRRHAPRRAYVLASLVEMAAARQPDVLLHARAAFNVAHAANAWVQPERTWQAAQRARRRFRELGDTAWVAACDWQEFAIPWATNNFEKAADTLQGALDRLQGDDGSRWRFDCRLSLAFAHLLLSNFDPALAIIEQCEQEASTADDALKLARALLHKAAYYRRRWRFDEALPAARQAHDLLEMLDHPLALARANFQIGQILHLQGQEYDSAEARLEAALHTFSGAAVDLWTAQCHYALARIYRETGRLEKAEAGLQDTLSLLRRYPIKGLLADLLLDSAVFYLYLGRHEHALALLDEAEPIFTQLKVGIELICQLHRGQIYAEMDRYQLALQRMEHAYHGLVALQDEYRIAEAALRLGDVWLWLGRPATAIDYFQQALAYFEQVGHTSYLGELYSLLTAARQRNGEDLADVISAAQRDLDRLQPHGVQPYLALLQRYLGEACLAAGRLDEALYHLQTAHDNFRDMGLEVEVAECCVPLARCYVALSRAHDARQAYRRALALSQDSLPAIIWPAHAGLAELAAAEDNAPQALMHYEQMFDAFGHLRRTFWQPSLAGAYLDHSAEALDRAVGFAAAHDAPQLARFVEESKAQTLVRRLQQPPGASANAEQQRLADEIRWLHSQVGAARQSGAPTGDWLRLQNELVATIKRHEAAAARAERQATAHQGDAAPAMAYEEEAFRNAATAALGDRWLALNYYLTATSLVCVLLGPGERQSYSWPQSAAVQRALQVAARPSATEHEAAAERALAARWLLPPSLASRLSPDTTLIISPHRRLHSLPWAALPLACDGAAAPLVSHCAPLLTPSLHSYTLLAQRRQTQRDRRAGCVIAISDFAGRRPALPAVGREAELLAARLNAQGRLVSDDDAAWETIRRLGLSGGLAAHAFVHIASHAFFDGVTGRASGLALHDRDVWLDELWDLAPLPSLVTLSGCSTMQSYLYEGDEQISLAATCFQAGTRTIAGSLWRVPDEHVPLLTDAFYERYIAGEHPALALAHAQRLAISAGVPWQAWAPLLCMGGL